MIFSVKCPSWNMLPFRCQGLSTRAEMQSVTPCRDCFFFTFFPESRISKSQGKDYGDEGDLVEKVTAPYAPTAYPGCSLAPWRQCHRTALQATKKTPASCTLNVAKNCVITCPGGQSKTPNVKLAVPPWQEGAGAAACSWRPTMEEGKEVALSPLSFLRGLCPRNVVTLPF